MQKLTRSSNLHQFSSKVERNEPIEKEAREGWITWGEDNIHPQLLNSWRYDNAVHGGIINQKVRFITAGGLTVEGDPKILDNFRSPFTMQEVIESASDDLETAEQFYIEYKKNLDGNWEANNIEASLIRVDKTSMFFHYSEDWSIKQQSLEKTGYRTIKNIHNIDLNDELDRVCLMQVQTRPKQRVIKVKGKNTLTSSYYPIPNYSGALTSIKAGIKMTFFVYSEVSNGYKGGTWVNLANGVPATKEEEDKIVSKVKAEASDEDLWGGLVVTFSDGKEREPRISQINGNDLDKRYSSSKKDVVREIMIAHGVISQSLFGVMSDSLFGSKEEMETAYILFKENYVKYRQRTLIEPINWANKKLNDIDAKISFNDYTPPIFGTPEVEMKKEKFNSEDAVLLEFSKRGISKDGVEIIFSKSYNPDLDEETFKANYLNGLFAAKLTDDQQTIVSMLKDGHPYSAINTAIGKGANYLSNQLIKLGDLGLVDGWALSERGKQATQELEQFKVVYSYELRSDAPPLVKGGKSRAFCEQLVKMNKLYTLEEINQISTAIDRNVFLYRGGWYHNPETEVNTPSCRHEWRQIII
jgi:hypothetical protein